jgi:hypothetical protein
LLFCDFVSSLLFLVEAFLLAHPQPTLELAVRCWPFGAGRSVLFFCRPVHIDPIESVVTDFLDEL